MAENYKGNSDLIVSSDFLFKELGQVFKYVKQLLTKKSDVGHTHNSTELTPITSKTYTNVIAVTNDIDGGSLYFGQVIPSDYNTPWRVKYKITSSIKDDVYGGGIFDVELYGSQSSRINYRIVNTHTNVNHRSLYYHMLYSATSTSITNGIGHLIGIGLRNSYNCTNSNYSRTFVIDILECENCHVNMYDTMSVFANLTNLSTSTHSGRSEWDGCNNGLRESGDDNNIDRLLDPNIQVTAGSNKIYTNTLIMQLANGNWESPVLSSTTGTSKTVNTNGFRPETIYYYTNGGNVSANAKCNQWTLFSAYSSVDLRYSTNCGQTLNRYQPVYFVGTIGSDGLFYFDTTKWYTQTLPTYDDGKVYIRLGVAYGGGSATTAYQIGFAETQPIYQWKNGRIQLYVGNAETVNGHTVKSDVPENAKFTDTTYTTATSTKNGLLSKEDKIKLDTIATGANNYVLPVATTSALGGIQLGYSQTGKNYPVQVSSNKAYVNVPWQNTWRGIQDNLTSTSTTDSLSANQGKVLKALIDAKAPSTGSASISKLASSITLGDGNGAEIYQKGGNYHQKITIEDNSTSNDAVFSFQQSADNGANFKDLMKINDDGTVVANYFKGTFNGLLNGTAVVDTMTATKYITAPSFIGEGDNSKYYHRLDFGKSGKNTVDFYEYGGIYNFYKNTTGAKADSVLLGQITDSGWVGNVTGNVTGNATTATSATSATKATQDSAGQQINTTYLKNITNTGSTINLFKGDNSSTSFDLYTLLQNNANLNNIITSGWYYVGGGNSCTNKPANVDAFGLEVIRSANGWWTQKLYASSANMKTYIRWYSGTEWTSWQDTTVLTPVPANAKFTDTTYTTGTASKLGLTKLYTSTGTSTDGTMTRKAITEALNGKSSTSHTHTATDVGAIPATLKGVANGVAELDANGKVPSAQLPSFVDDVVEGYYSSSKFYSDSAKTTVITGEKDKIYVDLTTNKTYRWSGSAYVEISKSLALGETSSSAYRGDRGKIAYNHSQSAHAPSNAERNAIISISKNGTALNIDSTNRSVNIEVPLLYTSTGTSTDGTMTQKAITEALNGKSSTSHNHDSVYLLKSGGTMNGTAFISFADSGNVNKTDVTYPVSRGGLKWNGQTDYISLYSEETGKDNLNLVMKLGDDNSNSFVVKDKSGNTKVTISANGNINAQGGFTGNLSGNATTATTATKADKLTTARNIGITGAVTGTATSFDGSSNISINTTSVQASKLTGSLGNNVYINTHPENSGAVIPFINNDLAFLTKRGGSVSVYTTTDTDYTPITLTNKTAVNADMTNAFDGSFAYSEIRSITSASTVLVIDIVTPVSYQYSTKLYYDCGNAQWRAKKVQFYVYNTNEDNPVYHKITDTTCSTGHVTSNVAYTYTQSGVTGKQGFNRWRIVLTDFVTPSLIRFAQIGIVNFGSVGAGTTLVSRGRDDALYRNFTPASNSTYDLGSSSKKWKSVYATTFYGSLSGNATSATSATKATQDSAGQQINTTYIKSVTASESNGIQQITITKGNGTTSTFVTKDTTYSVATSAKDGLLSASLFGKLSRIADGAEVNVNPDWAETDAKKKSYIRNKPTIPVVEFETTSLDLSLLI